MSDQQQPPSKPSDLVMSDGAVCALACLLIDLDEKLSREEEDADE